MTVIVDGLYKHGHIELPNPPADLPEGPGRVIVMPHQPAKQPPCYLTFGKYPGDHSTLEDFRDAEWHGEAEFDQE